VAGGAPPARLAGRARERTHALRGRAQQAARRLGDQPEERAGVERRYQGLEQPFLAERPPEDWETPRESVVERPIGARMTTEEDLQLREMRAHTGRPWRHLRPGDGQPRPDGYGPNEDVWIEEVDGDDG
jgi:hypothetical protein